jgi:hypothetical protein
MEEKSINWKDLLDSYSKSSKKPRLTPEESELETTKQFLEFMEYEKKGNSIIPKFYYKKPINYNDLYFNLKTEAKNRFLTMKSYELPQKNRKLISHFL